jgi:hypothetical protein
MPLVYSTTDSVPSSRRERQVHDLLPGLRGAVPIALIDELVARLAVKRIEPDPPLAAISRSR